MSKKQIFQETKHFWESKTIWVGALTVMAGIDTAVAADVSAGVPLTFLGLLNIILRVLTKTQVTK